MSFLLDTDTCSAHFRDPRRLFSRFLQYAARLHVSTVTLAELYSASLRIGAPAKYQFGISELLRDVVVLPAGQQVAYRCGHIRAWLADRGLSAGLPDMLIAATALEHNLTLVTHNTADFAHVPGLQLQDWLNP